MYVWADGIHVNVRLENEADQRQCLLVLTGVTVAGQNELIAVVDGYRESEQSWYELLVDLQTRGLSLAPKLAIEDGGARLLGIAIAVGMMLGGLAKSASTSPVPGLQQTCDFTRISIDQLEPIADGILIR